MCVTLCVCLCVCVCVCVHVHVHVCVCACKCDCMYVLLHTSQYTTNTTINAITAVVIFTAAALSTL